MLRNARRAKLYYIIVDRDGKVLYNLGIRDYKEPVGRVSSGVGAPQSVILTLPAKRCGEVLGEGGGDPPTGLLAPPGDNRCLGLWDSRLVKLFW